MNKLTDQGVTKITVFIIRLKFKRGCAMVPRTLNKKYEPNGYCYYQNIITTLQRIALPM